MTATPEQIEAALSAFALASGLGIFPNDEKDEEWREDLVNGMRAAINAMRPFIRAEVLEEAARICDEADVKEREFFVGADNAIDEVIYDRGSYVARISAAAIRTLKENP